jgi:hypothetical protein
MNLGFICDQETFLSPNPIDLWSPNQLGDVLEYEASYQ